MIVTTDLLKNILHDAEKKRELLYHQITKRATYIAAVTEDPASLRPDFDLEEVTAEITALDTQIIKLKHFRNIHNSTHIVGNTGMTADEILIQVALLGSLISTYSQLISKEAKQRVESSPYTTKNIIEYEYINFDSAKAQEILDSLISQKDILFMELDKFNALDEFEIPD